MNLKLGEFAPQFELEDQNYHKSNLSDYLGKIVILYFYPRNDTPGCTKEACNFTNIITEYINLGAVVVGVSRDSVESHKKFISKYNLQFDLLSDKSAKVHELYEVIKPKKFFGKTILGTVRTTFVIDKQGKIANIFENVKVDGHNLEILKFVRELSRKE